MLWALLMSPTAAQGHQGARVDGAGKSDGKRLNAQVGPRPYYLLGRMSESSLKSKLHSCAEGPFHPTEFSIGHRGAPLQFPEHTRESYEAAARMGAGVLECDVTFTSDGELVCRHSQCDLHTTTNILTTPLAGKCSQPFAPADRTKPASARCCTSDITLAEFKTLCGKMDAADRAATTIEGYLDGTVGWRTDLYTSCGTLLTHRESIELIDTLGAGFAPELKAPSVAMPFDTDGDGVGDFSQEDYAQKLIDEYRAAGIRPHRVRAQSFNLADVRYWLASEPEFGQRAVYLDSRDEAVDPMDPDDPGLAGAGPTLTELAAEGVRVVAPPMWYLLKLKNGAMVPSRYAEKAKAAGLDLITWTLERSGRMREEVIPDRGYYYQSVVEVLDNDGDILTTLHVLARDVGIIGIFSDWPGTVTYYANCMNLR